MDLSEKQVQLLIAKIDRLIPDRGFRKKKDFYEASGINSSLYSQWNTGIVKPSAAKIFDAAEALGMSTDELLSGIVDTPPISDEPNRYVKEFQRITDGMSGKRIVFLLHALEALATVEEISRFA